MIFVPLPLLTAVLLIIVAVRFCNARDMTHPAHRLFAALIVLYAVQSVLLTLRWGYDVSGAAMPIALVAPVLPVIAYLAYTALTAPLSRRQLWPLGVIALHWGVYGAAPQATDALIILTYIGFGSLLIWQARKGPDRLTVPPLSRARDILTAMALTGATLIASALTDIYVIYDFIQNQGRNVGLVVTFVQTVFVLLIGVAATWAHAAADADTRPRAADPLDSSDAPEDTEIITRLEELFDRDALHQSEDISLRKLARRLGLPDRRVSNAINRSAGQSVSQFVNERRVRDACTLLQTTDDTVLAVSLAAGFATKSNFNREFQRVAGQSPSAWRRANRR